MCLCILYKNGWGVEQDGEKAFYWASKAADREDPAPVSLFLVAEMYYFGIGVEKELKEAARWCKLSAEAGSYNGCYQLGMMYKNGEGFRKSYKKALEYLDRAADYGVADAAEEIAEMYEDGLGVKRDEDKAEEWYETHKDIIIRYGSKKVGLGRLEDVHGTSYI